MSYMSSMSYMIKSLPDVAEDRPYLFQNPTPHKMYDIGRSVDSQLNHQG